MESLQIIVNILRRFVNNILCNATDGRLEMFRLADARLQETSYVTPAQPPSRRKLSESYSRPQPPYLLGLCRRSQPPVFFLLKNVSNRLGLTYFIYMIDLFYLFIYNFLVISN